MILVPSSDCLITGRSVKVGLTPPVGMAASSPIIVDLTHPFSHKIGQLTVKIETDCGIGFSEVVSSCDFIFSGIFYCNVTHNKRAIKGILVFLLGDNLKQKNIGSKSSPL